MARLSPTGACCQAILSCFSSTGQPEAQRRAGPVRESKLPRRADPAARLQAPPRLQAQDSATSTWSLPPGGILADYTQFARLAVGTEIVSHPTSNGSACASVSLKPAPLWPGNRT